MKDISKACENLEEGDLIRLQYDEGIDEEGIKIVIATYLSHDSQKEILTVGRILVPMRRDEYSDPTIYSTRFARFSEIRGLEKFVPETLA